MCQYSAVDGVVQPWHHVHLGEFAIGRAGLVITEAAAVVPEGRITPDDAGLWNEAQRDAWMGIVKFSHSQGVPISIPAFIVGLIWEFTSLWNDFLFAVVLTTGKSWPVTVALNNIAGSQIVQWNVQMAGAVLASLPTIIVYILLGKYFLRGMLSGSLKG
jgi:hypothetical protein